MPTAFWVCGAVTAVSALVSLGYSLAALARTEASNRTSAMYAVSRSVALAVAAIIALFVRSIPYLAALALAMIIVQALDAIVGATIRDRLKTVGPAVTAVVNAAALIWLLQQ